MAKLNRERKLVERRLEKQAKKDAKRAAAHEPDPPADALTHNDGMSQPDQLERARQDSNL